MSGDRQISCHVPSLCLLCYRVSVCTFILYMVAHKNGCLRLTVPVDKSGCLELSLSLF